MEATPATGALFSILGYIGHECHPGNRIGRDALI
jgi:hypothetical protein